VIFVFPGTTENAELTPLLRLGAGACAGIIAMSATYPMDMVRGRLTVQGDIVTNNNIVEVPSCDQ
jgi:hypothetical protein